MMGRAMENMRRSSSDPELPRPNAILVNDPPVWELDAMADAGSVLNVMYGHAATVPSAVPVMERSSRPVREVGQ